MLVFEKEKLVFFALPKTGTTALEAALGRRASLSMRKSPNLRHLPGYLYEDHMKDFLGNVGLENLETLCLLRNPIDWLGSWYRYRSRPAVDGRPNSTKNMTFDAFVDEFASDHPAKWVQVGNPPRFIRDKTGMVMMDHVFQYEQMDLLIAFLEDRFGTKIGLDRHNVSPAKDMALSSAIRSRFEAKHAQMFEDWEAAHR